MAKDYKEIKGKLDQKKISLRQILEAIKKDEKILNAKKVGLEVLKNKKAKENQKPENKGQNNKPSSPSDNKPNTNNKANNNDSKSNTNNKSKDDDKKTSEDAEKLKKEKFREALVNLKMAYKRALSVLERAENYMKTAKMSEAKRAKLEVLVIRQKLILEKVRILIEKLEAKA